MLTDRDSLIFAAVARKVPGLKMVFGSQVPEIALSSLYRTMCANIELASSFPSDTELQTLIAQLVLKKDELLCCDKLSAPFEKNVLNRTPNTAPTISDVNIDVCVGDTVTSTFDDIFSSYSDTEGNQPGLFRIFNIEDNTNISFNGSPIVEYQTYHYNPFSLVTTFDHTSFVPSGFTEPDPAYYVYDTTAPNCTTPNIIYYSSSQLQALLDQGYQITDPFDSDTIELTNFTQDPPVVTTIPAFNQGTGFTTTFQTVIRDNDQCEPLFSNSSTVTLNFQQKECSPVPDCSAITCATESTQCDVAFTPTLCPGDATHVRIESIVPNLSVNPTTLTYFGATLTAGTVIPVSSLDQILFTPDGSVVAGATAMIIEYSLSLDGINYCTNNISYTIEIDVATPPVVTPFTPVNTEASSVELTGVFSSVDNVASVLWTLVSGPNSPNIQTPSLATTIIDTLITGAYVFNFEVTTTCGQMDDEDITVTVSDPDDNAPQVLGVTFPNGPCCNNSSEITFDTANTVQVTDSCDTLTTICVDGPLSTSVNYTFQYTVTDTSGPTVLLVTPPSQEYTAIFDGSGDACLVPINIDTGSIGGSGSYDIDITVNFVNGDTVTHSFNQSCS